MTKPNKYVARYQGAIVGERRSPRPYRFAIVAQRDEAAARAAAYGYEPTETDKLNFEWDSFVATCSAGVKVTPPEWNFPTMFSADAIEQAKAHIEGDWPACVARLKAKHIAWFEQSKALGAFKPYVASWSMSRLNAEKATQRPRMGGTFLAIVDAEVPSKQTA